MRYMSDQEQDYFRSRTLGWLDPFSIFSIEPIDQFLEGEELDAQQKNTLPNATKSEAHAN